MIVRRHPRGVARRQGAVATVAGLALAAGALTAGPAGAAPAGPADRADALTPADSAREWPRSDLTAAARRVMVLVGEAVGDRVLDHGDDVLTGDAAEPAGPRG